MVLDHSIKNGSKHGNDGERSDSFALAANSEPLVGSDTVF